MPNPSYDLHRIELAKKMLVLGIRPHLVAHSLGFPPATMIDWYQQLTGERTSRGPLKSGASSYITSWEAARKLSVFVAIYKSVRGPKDPSKPSKHTHLIMAIEQYNRICAVPIDGTMAWLARRDFDAEVITQKLCTKCRTRYPYYLQTPHMRKCPFCVPPRAPRRTKEGEKGRAKPQSAPPPRKNAVRPVIQT